MEVFRKNKPVNKIRLLFVLCCVVIPVANWIIFYIYPNLNSFKMAFTNRSGEWSFENFIRFYNELMDSESELRIAFKNTFLTFGVIVLYFPFQVLVSYFLYKKVPFYRFYKIVFFIPTILFSLAVGMIFSQLIGVEGFIAQGVQKCLKLDYVPELLTDTRFANTVVILQMLWLGFPGSLIIWGGAFARIPEEVLESARVDGVNWWKEFTRIIVPLVWPTFALQLIFLFCGIFSASGAVFILTGGKFGTMTLSCWIYLQMYYISGDYTTSNAFNYMSAVGMVLSVVAITISLMVRKITDKFFNDVEY